MVKNNQKIKLMALLLTLSAHMITARKEKTQKVQEQVHASEKYPLTLLHNLIIDQTISSQERLIAIEEFLRNNPIDQINARNANGETALNLETMRNCDLQVVKLLLQYKADPTIPNIFGQTPLHNAVFKGNYEMAQLLLNSGAEQNFKNDQGLIAAQLAQTLKTKALFANQESDAL